MKNLYLSPWRSKLKKTEQLEESQIESAAYHPNERIIYRGHRFTLKYAEIRNSELVYFAIHEKSGNPYFIPERVLAQ